MRIKKTYLLWFVFFTLLCVDLALRGIYYRTQLLTLILISLNLWAVSEQRPKVSQEVTNKRMHIFSLLILGLMGFLLLIPILSYFDIHVFSYVIMYEIKNRLCEGYLIKRIMQVAIFWIGISVLVKVKWKKNV